MDIIRLFADGFPLTIERLQFLQNTYTKAISQLTRIAGNGNMILDGVVVSGSNVSSGIIVINGEVLEFQGGAFNSRVAVFETVDEVPYNIDADNDGNLDLKVADVVRTARCAASGGVDAISFSSLQRVGSLQLNQFPIGAIIPFDGDINNLPAGWELYNMADQFIMGAGGTHSLNGIGGANSVTLTESQMPSHNHTGTTSTNGNHTHSVPNEVGGDNGSGVHFRIEARNRNRQQGRAAGSHNHTVTTNSKGGSQPHENRPRFKALNFIRFVGF